MNNHVIFDPRVVSAGFGAGSGTVVSLKLGYIAYRWIEISYGIPLTAEDKDAVIVVVAFFSSFVGALTGALLLHWLRALKLPVNGERGVTLIELMVAVAILGILASIAVPQFQSYRKRAYDAAARSDLRNAATAEEHYASMYGSYTESIEDLKSASGLRLSPGVEVRASVAADHLTLTARATICAPGTGEWTYSTATNTVEGKYCQ